MHPRLLCHGCFKTWMPGTSSAKTRFALLPGHDELNPRRNALAAAHRRHHHLITPAGAAVDFLPGAELQILVPPDPPLTKPRPVPRPPPPHPPPPHISPVQARPHPPRPPPPRRHP